MAKLMEATQTVTDLYLLRSLMMSKYDLQCFALDLSEIVEHSTLQMMTRTTRGKHKIYNNMRRTKMKVTQYTNLI